MNPFQFIQAYCRQGGDIQPCLQGLYNMGLGISIALAFLFVVVGAFQYMLGGAINQQQAGKNKMLNAIWGLVIIFVSGVVLYWINPNIFSAELIVYKIKEGGLTPPVIELKEIKGTIVTFNDPEFTRITGTKNAIENTELSGIPGNIPPEIQRAIALAHKYANSDAGRQEYIRKYSRELSGANRETSCSHFVWLVLKEAGAIPSGQCWVNANTFPSIFSRLGWKGGSFNINSVQPGDVVVNQNIGSMGHIAMVIPVQGKDGQLKNALAHASYNKTPGQGKPPRIGVLYNGFDFIFRKQ